MPTQRPRVINPAVPRGAGTPVTRDPGRIAKDQLARRAAAAGASRTGAAALSGAAGSAGLGAAALPVLGVLGAGAAGVGIGTLIDKIPGVSQGVQSLFGAGRGVRMLGEVPTAPNRSFWEENGVVHGPGHRVLGRSYIDRFIPIEDDLGIAARRGGSVGGSNTGSGSPYGPAPIVTGLGRDGRVDRSQSDQYRAGAGQQTPAFPMTPQGQYERYFKSGEMDRYFGAASRGAGAPGSLAAMQELASQQSAPTSSPLASYYRSQSAAGRGNMDEIVSRMGYTGPMAEWAKANPMLAYREYNKKFPGGPSAFEKPIGSLQVPVEKAFSEAQMSPGFPGAKTSIPAETWTRDMTGGANPYQMPNLMQGSPAPGGFDVSQLYGKGAPNQAAFTLPGGAFNQGEQVSFPFKQAANVASMYTNPQNFGTPEELAAPADPGLQTRLKNFFAGVGAR